LSPSISLRDAVVVSGGYPLLSGVSLEVSTYELTVLTGPNGAGKTSLLRLVAGLERLSRGAGSVLGIDLDRGNRRALRQQVGWLGHEGSFYDDLSVRDNLRFAARALGRPVSEIAPALERLGLASRAETATGLLSAGQRRRLGLSWLLVRRPQLWILDEPYASLDDEGRTVLNSLLAHVVEAGASVLMSAHDPLGAGAPRAVTVEMAGGRIVGASS
jgi:heme ABC exporter ATP-binding subunit CcmA